MLRDRLSIELFIVALKLRRGWLVEQLIDKLEGNVYRPRIKA